MNGVLTSRVFLKQPETRLLHHLDSRIPKSVFLLRSSLSTKTHLLVSSPHNISEQVA